MDDLISRRAAIDALEKQADTMSEWSERYAEQRKGVLTAINIVEDLPSAQPEIIRCKDCKYSEYWYRDKRRCFLWSEAGIDVFEDGFCNYAKRRTDE